MSFTARQFAEFNGLLAASVERGLPLEPALTLFIDGAGSAPVKDALRGVRDGLREGRSLEGALATAAAFVPEGYPALVAAGERSGRLSEVLRRAEERYAASAGVKERAARFAIYVVAGLVLAFAVMGVSAWLVTKLRAFTPWIERVPGVVGLLFRHPWILLPSLAVLLALGAWSLAAGLRGASKRGVGYWLPLLGGLFRSRDLALICDVLAMRLRAGAPLPEALEAAERATSNRRAKRELEAARRRVAEGVPLSDALHGRRWFPRALAWALSLAEARGEAPDTFETFASVYASDVERRLEIVSLLVTPLGTLAIGNLVFFPVLVLASIFLELIGRGRY